MFGIKVYIQGVNKEDAIPYLLVTVKPKVNIDLLIVFPDVILLVGHAILTAYFLCVCFLLFLLFILIIFRIGFICFLWSGTVILAFKLMDCLGLAGVNGIYSDVVLVQVLMDDLYLLHGFTVVFKARVSIEDYNLKVFGKVFEAIDCADSDPQIL